MGGCKQAPVGRGFHDDTTHGLIDRRVSQLFSVYNIRCSSCFLFYNSKRSWCDESSDSEPNLTIFLVNLHSLVDLFIFQFCLLLTWANLAGDAEKARANCIFDTRGVFWLPHSWPLWSQRCWNKTFSAPRSQKTIQRNSLRPKRTNISHQLECWSWIFSCRASPKPVQAR